MTSPPTPPGSPTPGPWEFFPGDEYWAGVIARKDGAIVWRLKIRKEDAQLIAAVHDLLEVAEELATAGIVFADPRVSYVEVQVNPGAIERARAAIRKATGA